MAKQKVTIVTIADALGLSFSTVSKALNNNPVIKKETRELVMKKAEEMGYSPNANARALSSSKSMLIGLLMNDVGNPQFGDMVSRISRDMARLNYTTMMFNSRFREEDELRNIRSVTAHNLDAIVVFPTDPNGKNMELLRQISDKTIIVGSHIPGLNSSYVTVDYRWGGYLGTSHMLEKGNRHIIIISEPAFTDTSQQFMMGVQKAFEEYGISPDPSMVYHARPVLEEGYRVVMEALDRDPAIQGVVCICDSLCYGAYKAARERKLSIPDDLSIVGMDDYEASPFLDPALTTVRLPSDEMATRCIELLTDTLKGGERRTVYIEPALCVRNSVRDRTQHENEK